jgi:Sigma-70, region 4
VVLSYLEGKTNEEVAALLKWPVGTVKGRLSRGRALLRSRLTRRGVALSAGSLLWALSGSRLEAADVSAELLRRTLKRALESGSSPHGSHVSSSPSQTSAEDTPSGKPAPSATEDAEPPSRPPGKKPGRSGVDWLMAAAALLLVFLTSVFVGGCVSATAYGGRFPDLRLALHRFSPWSWRSGTTPCRLSTIDSTPGAAPTLNRTSTPPSEAAGGSPPRGGR